MRRHQLDDGQALARQEKALQCAQASWSKEMLAPTPLQKPTEYAVLGDPQASIRKVFAHLDSDGLLGEDGWLKSDTGLICVGDYFDYPSSNHLDAGLEGIWFLSWLSAHSANQVIILMGNHDAERVMSLGGASLTMFSEALAAFRNLSHIQDLNARRTFLTSWAKRRFHGSVNH